MQKKFEILFFPRFEYPGNGSGLQLKFHGIQCGIHRVCLIGDFHRNDHFVPSFFPEIHGDSPLKHLFSGINKPNAEFIDNGRRFIFQFKCTECITELW